jgi:hypothetical protein
MDHVWEVFFIILPAEIGLLLVAVSAFRALFVSRVKERRNREWLENQSWYCQGKGVVRRLTSYIPGKTRSGSSGSGGLITDHIPHATMTGIHTFIDEVGRPSKLSSEPSETITDNDIELGRGLKTFDSGVEVSTDVAIISEIVKS